MPAASAYARQIGGEILGKTGQMRLMRLMRIGGHRQAVWLGGVYWLGFRRSVMGMVEAKQRAALKFSTALCRK